VHHLVDEVVAVLRSAAAGAQVRLVTEVAADLDKIVIDAARLKQVLFNYISNAIKFSPRDGTVHVRARIEDGDTFRLEVEDHGVGIAAKDLDKLFVEFQQLHGSRQGSTGLGLALTKRLVEAQGGSVGVRSTLGLGSTFYALLPRQA